jgi:hypothetical protein
VIDFLFKKNELSQQKKSKKKKKKINKKRRGILSAACEFVMSSYIQIFTFFIQIRSVVFNHSNRAHERETKNTDKKHTKPKQQNQKKNKTNQIYTKKNLFLRDTNVNDEQ